MKTSTPHTHRRRRLPLLLLFAILPVSSLFAAPAIQHWTTANGVRVYYVHTPELPMVDIQFIFDAGGARDDGHPGLAKLTNALLDQGAGGLDADQIAQRLEQVGAQLSTSSHRDMAIVGLRSLTDPDLLQPATEIMARILGQPAFPAEALERRRKRMLVALQAQQESPGDIAQKDFYAALYGDHPYAVPPTGTKESLKALTRGEVRDYYRRYYVARNAVVAVVGALDRARVESLVERLAGALAVGERATALPPVTPLAKAVERHIEYPSSQTHILMGQPGMKRKDTDYFPLYVGNHVLGGSGLVSRISEEIREKRGLAYSAYSYFMPMRELGPYTLGLQTRNDKAGEALTLLRKTLQRFIDEGPTTRELKASKRNITGGVALRISSNGKIVSNLAMIGFYGLPLDYLETFNDHVEAVTREQIRAAFQRRIHPDRMVTVTVGPSSPQGG